MVDYIDTRSLYHIANRFSAASSDMRRQAGRVQSAAGETEGVKGWNGPAGIAFRAAAGEMYSDLQTFCDAFDRASGTLNSLASQFDQVNALRRQVEQLQHRISNVRSEMGYADEHQRERLRYEISQLNWQLQDVQMQADSQFHRADNAATGSFHEIMALMNRLHVVSRAQSAATSSSEPSTWDKVGGFFNDLWKETGDFVENATEEGGVAGGVLGFFQGIGDSVLDTLEGLWQQSAFHQAYQAMRDPEGTFRKAQEIWKDVTHPVDAWENWHPLEKAKVIWSSISDAWERDIIEGNAYTRSRWAGYAAGTVLQAVLTDGIATEVSASAKVATAEARAEEILNAGRSIEEIEHVAEPESVVEKVIEKSGEVQPYRFSGGADAHTWASQHYGDWTIGLTPKEFEAVRAYTGSNYGNINSVLRGFSPAFEGENAQYTELISQALNKKPLPEAVTVFRGTDKIALGDLNELPYDQWIGKEVTEPAFMSTALVETSSFSGNVKLVLKLPAGTPGAYVGELSMFKEELEILLDKGTKFTIKDVQQIGTTIQIIGEVKLP